MSIFDRVGGSASAGVTVKTLTEPSSGPPLSDELLLTKGDVCVQLRLSLCSDWLGKLITACDHGSLGQINVVTIQGWQNTASHPETEHSQYICLTFSYNYYFFI